MAAAFAEFQARAGLWHHRVRSVPSTADDGPSAGAAPLLIGQGDDDGCAGATCDATFFDYGVGRTATARAQLLGGRGVDRIHGGAGQDRLDGGPIELNNVFVGGDGTDLCSNGPLARALYAGTDRGDIRHASCELPAPGKSQPAVLQLDGTYTMVAYSFSVAAMFDWANFTGQLPPGT